VSAGTDLSSVLADAGRASAARRWSYTVAVGAVALTAGWAIWAHLGQSDLAVAAMAGICLTALSAVDAKVQRLPNEGTLGAAGLALFAAFLVDGTAGLGRAAAGAGLTFLALFLLKLAFRRSMGWGDVKLGLALGAFGGFFGAPVVLFGLCAGFIVNGLVGASFLLTRHAQWGARLALGPSLSIGLLGAIALV
jgi:leader peptidase (prepilin peptidase)/N-methyltransferase